MPVQTETNRLNDVILWEGDFGVRYSRDTVTIKSGLSLALGAVIGKITAAGADQGKLKDYDPAAADGSEAVAGILVAAVDATNADTPGVAIARVAIAKKSGLVWKAGLTGAQITAGLAGLAAIGILTRDEA